MRANACSLRPRVRAQRRAGLRGGQPHLVVDLGRRKAGDSGKRQRGKLDRERIREIVQEIAKHLLEQRRGDARIDEGCNGSKTW